MISAVITTYNEAQLLNTCLESIQDFVEEIVIIDLESQENIKDVASKYKARFYSHPKVEYVELVRNFGISKAANEWVLILDPDEQISKKLSDELKKIASTDQYAAVNIPRKNIFFNRWVRHTNWWPDKHVRFFKKGKVSWSNKIHEYPSVDGKIYEIPAQENLAISHFGYKNVKDFFDRQNRYSTIEAQNRIDKGEGFSFINLVWWPTREFLARYIKHLGFLDGMVGFELVLLMMIYKTSVVVKMWEIKNIKK
jgi:glycosyltransferase involved in cell wall biosynthesis